MVRLSPHTAITKVVVSRSGGPFKLRPLPAYIAFGLLLVIVPGCGDKTQQSLTAKSQDSQLDAIAKIQQAAIENNRSEVAYFGSDPATYMQTRHHSNRLIPVYTFGTKAADDRLNLSRYTGTNSVYRSAERLRKLHGVEPRETLNPSAEYLDQTNIFDLQTAAIAAGKKHIFVVIFDGMSWHSTRAAAIAVSGKSFESGKGSGLFFLDYDAGGTSQYGWMVTAPFCDAVKVDVAAQSVGKCQPSGGYSAALGGPFPWSTPADKEYLKGKSGLHPYTDSAASASSMGSGIKTFNVAINVRPDGSRATTIAQIARDAGYATGTVTSVPFCHATPAGFAANNVSRNDYQNLARDMLGLPSASHPKEPLPGVDVVMGTGVTNPVKDVASFPGCTYLTTTDAKAINIQHGGKYVVGIRTTGKAGSEVLEETAAEAIAKKARMLTIFGATNDHLPFRTADGDYRPVKDNRGAGEVYSEADLLENPKLEEMTDAAISVLASRGKFWLMVEAGDVDWAKHWNSLDNMIGAIVSGDRAIEQIAKWVEKNSNWSESVMIVTSDHGHYFHLTKPEAIAGKAKRD